MKTTLKLLLLTSIFFTTAVPQGVALTPSNYIIACDIDGVILTLPKSQWPVIAYKSIKLIHNTQDMVDLPKTLWSMYKEFTQRTNGVKGIRDTQGNIIDGLTPQMLEIGMRHKEATRFVSPLLDIIETSRQLDKKVVKILKNSPVKTMFTTNKDSLTYQRAVKVHGLNTIATKAIVTKHPLSREVIEFAQRADTPASYRQLAEQYHNAKETETIIHAPDRKPNAPYYECMKDHSDGKKIFFIDDTKKNVDAFNKYLPEDVSFHYKGNPDQLNNELNKHGISTVYKRIN